MAYTNTVNLLQGSDLIMATLSVQEQDLCVIVTQQAHDTRNQNPI